MSKLSKSNFFSDPQSIIAVGVTVISLCALIVSIHQTKILKEENELMREHSRATVWPYLEFVAAKGHNSEDNSINQFNFSISNNGIGPAIITDVRVRYNDKIVQDWWELFNIQGIPDSIDYFITNKSFNGTVIQPGKTTEILNLDANLPLANEFFKRLAGLSLEIYYESIYGEKWKFDAGKTTKLENFNGLPEEEQFN